MQISTLIGKRVLSTGGAAYGYVTDVRLASGYKKISCLVCADGEEEEFYLPMRAVQSVSDAIIAKNARLAACTGLPSPIGRPAYSHTGQALGAVADVLVEEDGEAVFTVVGEGVRLSAPASLTSVAETVIVFPDAASKSAAVKGIRSAGGTGKKRSAPREKKTEQPPAKEQEGGQAVPIGRTNLLGRHLRRSVYDKRGAPIAIAGEKITPATLQAARRAGKLLELTVNTLTAYD